MFALLTTLNFSIGMMTYPALKACEDGWLPKGFAACNKRFGTPHWILLAFFLVGVVPILVGLDLTTLPNLEKTVCQDLILIQQKGAYELMKKCLN